MKVRELMSREVTSCSADTDLATVVSLMWSQDCGMIPILSLDGQLLGVVTDRDICVAVATRRRRPDELAVRDVIHEKPATCGEDDEVASALATMAREQVRRLPVTNVIGKVSGVLSLSDIIVAGTGIKKAGAIGAESVIAALKSICKPRLRKQTLVGSA